MTPEQKTNPFLDPDQLPIDFGGKIFVKDEEKPNEYHLQIRTSRLSLASSKPGGSDGKVIFSGIHKPLLVKETFPGLFENINGTLRQTKNKHEWKLKIEEQHTTITGVYSTETQMITADFTVRDKGVRGRVEISKMKQSKKKNMELFGESDSKESIKIEFSKSPSIPPESQILLKTSWDIVWKNRKEFADSFYKHLCETDDRSAALFKGVDMKKQGDRFMETLNIAINQLDKLEKFVPKLKALGSKHTDFQVDDDHYAPFGKALCWALETCIADQWNLKTRKAWIQFYGIIQATMRKGAEEGENKVQGCACIIS